MVAVKKLSSTPSETISSIIKQLMSEKNVTEAKLSQNTGIPQSTLHKIVSGQTEDPRISTLITISNYFNVSIDTVLSNDQSKIKTIKDACSIPVIDWKTCAGDLNNIKRMTLNNWENWETIDKNIKGSFGLISKLSIEPVFPRGTLLIIDTKATPSDGDYVLVLYKNTEEATLRQIIIDGLRNMLKNISGHVEPIEPNKATILGVLVQSRFSYKY